MEKKWFNFPLTRWINAMPNERSSLLRLNMIHVCADHFDCEWKKYSGGMRPTQPPSIFPGVKQSCLKQISSATQSTATSAEARTEKEYMLKDELDKIPDFPSFF